MLFIDEKFVIVPTRFYWGWKARKDVANTYHGLAFMGMTLVLGLMNFDANLFNE